VHSTTRPENSLSDNIFYAKGGKKFLAKANTMEKKIQTQNSLAKGGEILKTSFDWPKQKRF
jgi:hypothetical protein